MTPIIRAFFREEASAGILLMVATLFAFIFANTSVAPFYQQFISLPLGVTFGSFSINSNMEHFINDVLMTIFFLIIGLEVKRELVQGSLSGVDKALFPAIAALGGILVPALIYSYFNYADSITSGGWAIPTATDLAFAVGIMALLGKRVPSSLKIFLLALAIIDDLGAIMIIALFYTHEISIYGVLTSFIALALLVWMNRKKVGNIPLYLVAGAILWTGLFLAGIHTTLAGVIVGFLVPLAAKDGSQPSVELEHSLHPWVAYCILPLFAFVNAGVSIIGVNLEGLLSPLPLGIAIGLLIGKPLGIFGLSYLAVKLNIAKLPTGIGFMHIFAVSVLCGIGFTMSIFISNLAFADMDMNLVMYSKIGILLGSIIAAILGYILLRITLPTLKVVDGEVVYDEAMSK